MKPLAILLLLGTAAGADDLLPQPFAKDRYAKTLAKSPFILESKATVAPVQPPSGNLYLRGVSTVDGKDYVLIQRLGEERTMPPLIGNERSSGGLVVRSVRMGATFRETAVVVEDGVEVREVRFKVDSLSAPPAPLPPRMTPHRNPVVPVPNSVRFR